MCIEREAGSSSSSSIGKEDYAHQAFSASTKNHKSKNQLFLENNSRPQQLNFTSLPEPAGNVPEASESVIDEYTVKVPAKLKNESVSLFEA